MKPELLVASGQQQSTWAFLGALGAVIVFVLTVWLLDRLVSSLFPRRNAYHTSVGNVLMRVEAQFLPGRQHVLETLEHEETQEDDEGDPPKAGQTSRQ